MRYTKDQYNKAVEAVRASGRASTAFVSRELSIRYTDAVKIMLDMEKNGVVSEPNYVGKRVIIDDIAND